jgi:hypothetical protein
MPASVEAANTAILDLDFRMVARDNSGAHHSAHLCTKFSKVSALVYLQYKVTL